MNISRGRMAKYLMLFLVITLLTVGCDQLSESQSSQEVFEIQPSVFPTPTLATDLVPQNETEKSQSLTENKEQSTFKDPGCSNLPDDVICTCINGSWHHCYSLNDTEKKTTPKKLVAQQDTNSVSTTGSQSVKTPSQVVAISAPTINLEPSISQANSFVKVTGTGFPANSSILITYHYGSSSNNRATFTTDTNGNFSNNFTVPSDVITGRQNLVRASISTSGNSNTTSQLSSSATHFVPSNELILSSDIVVPGNTLTISGQSFSAYTSVKHLQLGNLNILPNPVPTADSTGQFSTEIVVPNLSSGLYLLVAIVGDKTSSTYINITNTSSYKPRIRVEPELSYPGSLVTVTGSNYPINTDVLITYSYGLSSVNVKNLSTGVTGEFKTTITIPLDTTVQTNNLIQTTSNAHLGNNIYETITAGARHYIPLSLIQMSKSKVFPGDILTLTGVGFTSNEPIQSITIGNSSIITMTNSVIDSAGKFSTEFVIPRLEPGIYLLTTTTPSITTSKFIEITN